MTRALSMLSLLAACAPAHEALPHGADAASCGTCHATQHAAWSSSAHATSGASPVFEAMLPAVETAWGVAARDRCVDCHEPAHGGDSGVGCVSCHAAVGNTAERDGLLRVELDTPLAGPFDDPVATSAHESRAGGFVRSASLCGTCHEVRGPGLFDEPTRTEHAESSYGAVGTTCADCHMPYLDEGEAAIGTGVRRYLRSHAFTSVDPPWSGDETAAAAATTALVARAVELSLEPAASASGVDVVLANVGAGHAVPTGAAFLRDLWVDVSFYDASGAVIAERSRVVELGSRMTRGGVDVALATDADHIEPRALAPDETRRTPVAVPSDALRAEAVLRFRGVRHETLVALGRGDLVGRAATLEIARAEIALPRE